MTKFNLLLDIIVCLTENAQTNGIGVTGTLLWVKGGVSVPVQSENEAAMLGRSYYMKKKNLINYRKTKYRYPLSIADVSEITIPQEGLRC